MCIPTFHTHIIRPEKRIAFNICIYYTWEVIELKGIIARLMCCLLPAPLVRTLLARALVQSDRDRFRHLGGIGGLFDHRTMRVAQDHNSCFQRAEPSRSPATSYSSRRLLPGIVLVSAHLNTNLLYSRGSYARSVRTCTSRRTASSE